VCNLGICGVLDVVMIIGCSSEYNPFPCLFRLL